jgi:hypothetical protein
VEGENPSSSIEIATILGSTDGDTAGVASIGSWFNVIVVATGGGVAVMVC